MNPFRKMFAGGEERFVKRCYAAVSGRDHGPHSSGNERIAGSVGVGTCNVCRRRDGSHLRRIVHIIPTRQGPRQFGLDLSTEVGEVLAQYGIDVKDLAGGGGMDGRRRQLMKV